MSTYEVRRRPPWQSHLTPPENWEDVEVAPGAASTPIFTVQVETTFWNRLDRRRVDAPSFTIRPPDRPI